MLLLSISNWSIRHLIGLGLRTTPAHTSFVRGALFTFCIHYCFILWLFYFSMLNIFNVQQQYINLFVVLVVLLRCRVQYVCTRWCNACVFDVWWMDLRTSVDDITLLLLLLVLLLTPTANFKSLTEIATGNGRSICEPLLTLIVIFSFVCWSVCRNFSLRLVIIAWW